MIACPFCQAELPAETRQEDGWNCVCGEFVPVSMTVDPTRRVCGKKKED